MSRLLRLLGSWSLYLGLTLTSVYASGAAAEPTRNPIPAQVTHIEGYPFPAKIAGLARGHKTDYNEPGLGFSVHYGKPGESWADIYIYNSGENLAAADPRKASAEQREIALGDIKTAVSAGSYQNATLIEKTEAAPFAKAHLAITQNRKTRDSYVFITLRKNNFVKIRLTTSAGNPDQLAGKFAAEYARLLKK